ncbi:hypothetical protein BDP27DRAFT_1426537 [Rhodocollybia butyracea]|uniref:Uncharacterized protein n=1 Tax=Rhodocollybia butyracea TaxID=206335 RepID=A0A9P5PI28_9AGAR|nr:hypothetical protein BDP27DRAFT_1426537 [Rhodocollybia butyracea]
MRSALILSALLTSSTRAAPPTPVSGSTDNAQAWLPGSLWPHLEPTVTTGITRVIVNFINGTTGEALGTEELKKFKNQQAVTKTMRDVFRLPSETSEITYRGSYLPQNLPGSPMDRQWVYVIVTGVESLARVQQEGSTARTHKTATALYAGLALGAPHRGPFDERAFKGRPDAKFLQTAVTRDQQIQWNKLMGKFGEHFMVPHSVIDGPAYPQTEITVTFIDGTSGEDLGTEEPEFPSKRHFTRIFGDLFGHNSQTCSITYRGRYSPQHLPQSPMDRQWVYFKLTGVALLVNFHSKQAYTSSSDPPYYVGISLGEPRRGRFIAFKDRPDAKPHQTTTTRLQQKEWNTILGEFQKHFMIHPLLPTTVTFVDKNGGPLNGYQDIPQEIEPFLTAQINQALDVPKGSIIYWHGPYPAQPRFFIKVIGGHPYCLPDDACFGIVNQPNVGEYLLPDLIFFAFLIRKCEALGALAAPVGLTLLGNILYALL